MKIMTGLLLIGTTLMAAPTGRYKVILDKLHALEMKHPTFARTFSIGKNNEGEDIIAMRVSSTPQNVDPKKIGQLVVSTHHGNELAAPEFTVYFLEQLLLRYESAELYKGNLADQEWTIIPVLNISGYNNNDRYENGKDPNRDYPGPCISSSGGKIKSIKTLIDYLPSRPFNGSLTVHGYAGALTYPWGVSVGNTHTADHNLFEKITAKAAAMNGYDYGTSTDIVYPCDGAYEDYVYWKYGMWSLLLELKSGSANDIASTSKAIESYFNDLDSSPSTQHLLSSACNRKDSRNKEVRYE